MKLHTSLFSIKTTDDVTHFIHVSTIAINAKLIDRTYLGVVKFENLNLKKKKTGSCFQTPVLKTILIG